MKLDHRFDGREDVGEETGEFVQLAAESSASADFIEELACRQMAAFVTMQQGRLVQEFLDLIHRDLRFGSDPGSCDSIIEVQQDLAEVEHNETRELHGAK